MDNRLNIILDMIDDGIGCVDVGTDHGYIPIALYNRGYSGKIIGTDINEGPLNSAIANARDIKTISFVKCDGLEDINCSLVDTIVIAGMGGDLICRIIDNAEWTMNDKYHLILQPMSKSEVLRYWLINNGYFIIEEKCFDIYSVLSVRFSGQNCKYNDYELYVGKNPNEKIVNKQLNYLSKKRNNPYFNNIYKELKDVYNK